MPRNTQGTLGVSFPSTIQNASNNLPIVFSQDIQGGLTNVATMADRLALPAQKLQDGMLIYQSNPGTYYKFNIGTIRRNADTGAFERPLGTSYTLQDSDFEEIQFDVDSITVSTGNNDPLPRAPGDTGGTTVTNPHDGDLYINSVTNQLWYYSGTRWFNVQGYSETEGDARYVQYNEVLSGANVLSSTEMQNARTNIGAVSTDEMNTAINTAVEGQTATLSNDSLTVSDVDGDEVYNVRNIANETGTGVFFDNTVDFRSGAQFNESSGYSNANVNHNNPNAFTTQQDIYQAIQAEREANGLVTGQGLGNHRYIPAFGYELANTWTTRNNLSPYTLSHESGGTSTAATAGSFFNRAHVDAQAVYTGYQIGGAQPSSIQDLGVTAARTATRSNVDLFSLEAVQGLIALIRAEEARTTGRIRSIRFLEGTTDRIEIHGINDNATSFETNTVETNQLGINTTGNTFIGTVGPFPITNVQVSRNPTGGSWVDIGLPEAYPQTDDGRRRNIVTMFIQNDSGDSSEKFDIRPGDIVRFPSPNNFWYPVIQSSNDGTRTTRIAIGSGSDRATLGTGLARGHNIDIALRRPYDSLGNVITEISTQTAGSLEYLRITLSDTAANLGLETFQYIKIGEYHTAEREIYRAGQAAEASPSNDFERINLNANQIAVERNLGTLVPNSTTTQELFRRIDFIDNNPSYTGTDNFSTRSYSLRPGLGDTLPDIGTNASRIQQALDDGNWVTLDDENLRAYSAGNVGSFQNNQISLAIDVRQYNSVNARIDVDRSLIQPGDIIRFVNPGGLAPSVPVIVENFAETVSPWGVQSVGIFVRRLTNPGLTVNVARRTTINWTSDLTLPDNGQDPNGRRIQVLRSNRYSISQEDLFIGHAGVRDTLSNRRHKLSVEAHKIYRSHDGNTWYIPHYAIDKHVDNSIRLETGLGTLTDFRTHSFNVGLSGFTGYYRTEQDNSYTSIQRGSQTLSIRPLTNFRYLNFRSIEEAAAIPQYGGITQQGLDSGTPSQVFSGSTTRLGNIDGTDFDVNDVVSLRGVSSYGPFNMLTNKRDITHVWTGYTAGATYPRIDYQLDTRASNTQLTSEETTDPFLPPGYRFIIHDKNNTTGVQDISYDEYLIADRETSESAFPETSRFLSGSVDRINRPVRFNSGSGFNTTFEANIDGITRHTRGQLAGSYELTLMRTNSFETNENLFPRMRLIDTGVDRVANTGNISFDFGPESGVQHSITEGGAIGNVTVAAEPGVDTWRIEFANATNASRFLRHVGLSKLNGGSGELSLTYNSNTYNVSSAATIFVSPSNTAHVIIVDPNSSLVAQSTATALTGVYQYFAGKRFTLPASTERDYHYQLRFEYRSDNYIINFTDNDISSAISTFGLYQLDSTRVQGIQEVQGDSAYLNARVYQLTHSEAEVQVPALLTSYNNGIDTRIRPGDLLNVDYSTPNNPPADSGQPQVVFDITGYVPAEGRLNIRNREFNDVVVLTTAPVEIQPGTIVQVGSGTNRQVSTTQSRLFIREAANSLSGVTTGNILSTVNANPNDWTEIQIPTTEALDTMYNTPGFLPGGDENVLQFQHNVLANLNALSDVTLELNNLNLADNDILSYDSGASIWTNKRAGQSIMDGTSDGGNVHFSLDANGLLQANTESTETHNFRDLQIDDQPVSVRDGGDTVNDSGTEVNSYQIEVNGRPVGVPQVNTLPAGPVRTDSELPAAATARANALMEAGANELRVLDTPQVRAEQPGVAEVQRFPYAGMRSNVVGTIGSRDEIIRISLNQAFNSGARNILPLQNTVYTSSATSFFPLDGDISTSRTINTSFLTFRLPDTGGTLRTLTLPGLFSASAESYVGLFNGLVTLLTNAISTYNSDDGNGAPRAGNDRIDFTVAHNYTSGNTINITFTHTGTQDFSNDVDAMAGLGGTFTTTQTNPARTVFFNFATTVTTQGGENPATLNTVQWSFSSTSPAYSITNRPLDPNLAVGPALDQIRDAILALDSTFTAGNRVAETVNGVASQTQIINLGNINTTTLFSLRVPPQNSAMNTEFNFRVTSEGAPGDPVLIPTIYTIRDPLSQVVTSFNSSAPTETDTDLPAVLTLIEQRIEADDFQPNFTVNNDSGNTRLDLTAGAVGPVNGLWRIEVNHGGVTGAALGNITFGTGVTEAGITIYDAVEVTSGVNIIPQRTLNAGLYRRDGDDGDIFDWTQVGGTDVVTDTVEIPLILLYGNYTINRITMGANAGRQGSRRYTYNDQVYYRIYDIPRRRQIWYLGGDLITSGEVHEVRNGIILRDGVIQRLFAADGTTLLGVSHTSALG